MKRLLLLIALSSVAMSVPANAVDLTAQITNLNGKPLVDQNGKDISKTLGDTIEEAMLAPDPQATKDEKNKRFWLAIKVHEKKEVELTSEERTMIKDVVSKMFPSPLLLGQVTRLLDPADKP